MFEQAVLPVVDVERFQAVKAAVEAAFSSSQVEGFLGSLERAKIRVREFEAALAKGLLGGSAREAYGLLEPGDQGQVREFYLARLEQVPAALRERFFRLYAYY